VILTVALWLVATLAHVALTARAIHRAWPAPVASLDERIFATVLAAIGSLSIVLHVTAMTTGIGLVSAIVALALWHGVLDRLTARRDDAFAGRQSPPTPFTSQERLAAAVITAVLLTWVGLAAASADVLGPDAAHYHVPYAINFAAGASPFSLPATPHLYPMAASVISAWFILPTGTPLLVDLAMTLPFALLIASLNLIFRCATGRSGLAWASWLGLALFATPMFRATAQGAADLWFAAAFVALVATIVRAWSIGRWRALDVVLAGAAVGLLVGSKTTGAPAAVLIAAAAAVVSVVRRLAGGPRDARPSRQWAAVAAAVIICVGAGAIWLIRNWIQYGSPLAPAGVAIGGYTIFPGETFQQTTYLSVLGEMQTDAFHLLPRARFFIDQWFGTWYLPALWPIAILLADLALSARRRRALAAWWPRVGFFVLAIVVSAALVWLLVGAPWTALERSRGLTLRYVLPVTALLPLLAFIGCFPFSVDWYARSATRVLVGLALIAAVAWLWWRALHPQEAGQSLTYAPGITVIWFVVAALLTTVLGTRGGRRLAVAALLIIALAWWAPMISRADAQAQAAGQARLDQEASALAAGPPTPDIWRRAFLTLRVAERAEGISCDRRRFFSLTRFDEPLGLQPPGFGSEVYYAGRDIAAARAAGPLHTCDYIITTPALQLTDKGQELAEALAAGSAGLRQVLEGSWRSVLFAQTPDLVILAMESR